MLSLTSDSGKSFITSLRNARWSAKGQNWTPANHATALVCYKSELVSPGWVRIDPIIITFRLQTRWVGGSSPACNFNILQVVFMASWGAGKTITAWIFSHMFCNYFPLPSGPPLLILHHHCWAPCAKTPMTRHGDTANIRNGCCFMLDVHHPQL